MIYADRQATATLTTELHMLWDTPMGKGNPNYLERGGNNLMPNTPNRLRQLVLPNHAPKSHSRPASRKAWLREQEVHKERQRGGAPEHRPGMGRIITAMSMSRFAGLVVVA